MTPIVDINLFAHNAEATAAAAIDSVLAQSWTNWRLTLIDDGSTDATAEIFAAYAAAYPAIRLKRNRINTGPVGAFQRGFWFGDADYVMPKSADDLIAPEFVERVMGVLLAHPDCAMAHAGGLSFQGSGVLDFIYPERHRLHAVGPDPLERAADVMRHYTSSPSFWGIYRRDAVDRLATIAHRAGWDHALLAELALYGEIRHTPEVLYWRRGGGRPVSDLARAATMESARGLILDDPIADALWRTPCITTAFAHVEAFCLARLAPRQRQALIGTACAIFAARWRPLMEREVRPARAYIGTAARRATSLDAATRELAALQLMRLLTALSLLMPQADLDDERQAVASLLSAPVPCLA